MSHKNNFEGIYFKHEKDSSIFAVIPGVSKNEAFIQVINNEKSFYFSYPVSDYKNTGKYIKVGGCVFSYKGINLNIQNKDTNISGRITYKNLTPLKYDIMGIFKFFPMECRHGIISMEHDLNGQITVNERINNFNGGKGYIETDSGVSFPKSYLWIHCNSQTEKCSISVSIADIPFAGFSFEGCICAIYHNNKEYRMATYLGVKIIQYNRNKIVLRQGKYLLYIDIANDSGQKLFAPQKGRMNRTVFESIAGMARFRFYCNNKLLFCFKANNASFEYANKK